MKRTILIWLTTTSLALSACLPGGVIMPVPLPHTDRPVVHGTMLEDGRPLANVEVKLKIDAGSMGVGCVDPDISTTTNQFGEFELPGNQSFWTVFWTDSDVGLSVCLPDTSSTAIWNVHFPISTYPFSSSDDIELTCNIVEGEFNSCATSLDDREMPSCTDDLDFRYPVGWLDVKSGNLFTGRCVDFHDNDKILERSDFVDGIRVGASIAFSESGSRDYQDFYIDGRRRRSTVWYEAGLIQRQTHYRSTASEDGQAVRHGLNTIWKEDGTVEIQDCWKDGNIVEISPDSCWFE